jgi:hypothetical protein
MRFRNGVVLSLLIGACSTPSESTTSLVSTTTAPLESTTTLEALVECPQIPYQVPDLPARVAGQSADPATIEEDEFTSLGAPGPFEDGLWVAGWFDNDGQERCDLYTMVFYPPIEPAEVETALASITRTP